MIIINIDDQKMFSFIQCEHRSLSAHQRPLRPVSVTAEDNALKDRRKSR